MATVATRPMTADEFWDWATRPENQDKHFELEDGRVVEVPPPGELHGVICAWIASLLWGYVRQRKRGYVCSNDTGLLVRRDPDTVSGPDILLFDESRPLEQMSHRYTDRLPLLIVEVLSPNDRIGRVTRRITRFLRRGVPMVWLVDPDARDVTVYRPDQDPVLFEGDAELLVGDVLAGFQGRLTDLFTLPGQ